MRHIPLFGSTLGYTNVSPANSGIYKIAKPKSKHVIILGNGFDLAHGMKTSYADFIEWYWSELGKRLLRGSGRFFDEGICSFKLKDAVRG